MSTTTTTRSESWEEVAGRLEASNSVTDQFNGALLRAVMPGRVGRLGVTLSKQRLLFVARQPAGPEKSYVLATFIGSETYEYIHVEQGAVRRTDRCGSAIRAEDLTGFLRDLIEAADVMDEEAKKAAAPVVEEIAEVETETEVVDAPPDGWIRPGAKLTQEQT